MLDEQGHPVLVRDQRTYTYDSHREARAERAKIIAAKAAGTYVRPVKVTGAGLVDSWLDGKRNLGKGTRRTYADALRRAVDILGHLPAQDVTKAHIDDMVTRLLASGRRVGNVRSKALSPRSVNITLARLSAVFEDAVRQGILGRNVVKLAERPSEVAHEMRTRTAESAAEFLRYVAEDRPRPADPAARRRPGGGVDRAPAAAAGRGRGGRGGVRPSRLATWRTRRAASAARGITSWLTSWASRTTPQWYSDRFAVLRDRAGLPRIRLHDTRHTCGTLMHLRGVPVAVISAWLGHSKASFTMDTYVHSQTDALTEASATLRTAYLTPQPEDVRNREK